MLRECRLSLAASRAPEARFGGFLIVHNQDPAQEARRSSSVVESVKNEATALFLAGCSAALRRLCKIIEECPRDKRLKEVIVYPATLLHGIGHIWCWIYDYRVGVRRPWTLNVDRARIIVPTIREVQHFDKPQTASPVSYWRWYQVRGMATTGRQRPGRFHSRHRSDGFRPEPNQYGACDGTGWWFLLGLLSGTPNR